MSISMSLSSGEIKTNIAKLGHIRDYLEMDQYWGGVKTTRMSYLMILHAHLGDTLLLCFAWGDRGMTIINGHSIEECEEPVMVRLHTAWEFDVPPKVVFRCGKYSR